MPVGGHELPVGDMKACQLLAGHLPRLLVGAALANGVMRLRTGGESQGFHQREVGRLRL
jgi:hypothetical protein